MRLLKWILLMTAAVGLGLPPAAGMPENAAEEMTLMAFNVGKADCLLLRAGQSAYLIDTGKGKNWERIEEGFAALGVTHVDGVVITHMDSDHVGGLKKMLKSGISADHLYAPAFFLPEKDGGENPAVKAAKKTELEVEFLRGGDELPLDGGKLLVLGPLRAATDKEDSNSLVLYAEAAGGSMLLAGDMEFPEESDLLNAGVIPRADVLKVGNHGDDDATSPALLAAVQPKLAVISTSTEEKDSTPAKRVLKALASWNTEVYQTQEAEWGILVTVRNGEASAERVDRLP